MCMIEGADGPVIVLEERHRVAKKTHYCSECGRMIQPRERYLRERYVFDNRASTHKTCQHCQVVREWLTKECGGFLYHGIGEDIEEHCREGYGFGVGRLAVGMRRKWRRRDNATLLPMPRVPRVSATR